MIGFDPKIFSNEGLLECYSDILDELKNRRVVRTKNSPISDYAEWMVANNLGLKLMNSSQAGYDAIKESDGTKFQIKCRSCDGRQLGVIRKLELHDFDYLIAVIVDEKYKILKVFQIPYNNVSKHAIFNKHQNGHILHLRGEILNDEGMEDITHLFRDTGADVSTKKPKLMRPVGQSNECKIGEYIRSKFIALSANDRLTHDVVEHLSDLGYCKEYFRLNFPLLIQIVPENELIRVDKHSRYWTKPILRIKGKEYLLCSQWFEYQRPHFITWLKANGFPS